MKLFIMTNIKRHTMRHRRSFINLIRALGRFQGLFFSNSSQNLVGNLTTLSDLVIFSWLSICFSSKFSSVSFWLQLNHCCQCSAEPYETPTYRNKVGERFGCLRWTYENNILENSGRWGISIKNFGFFIVRTLSMIEPTCEKY